MSLLGVCGFEYNNLPDDLITVIGGTPIYSGAELPPSSQSLTSLRGGPNVEIRRDWLSGGSAQQPSTDGYSMHFQIRVGDNNLQNDNRRFGGAFNGAEGIVVSSEDNTHLITIRVAGILRATAASAMFSLNNFDRVVIRVDHVNGGLVEVFLNGNMVTPVVSYTLTATDIANLVAKPNGFYVRMTDTNDYVDDLIAIDTEDGVGLVSDTILAACSVKPQSPTGNGADQDWTGDFSDIDEVPNNDADFISSGAIDEQSNFSHDAINQGEVHGVQVLARVLRVGTVAGAAIQTYITQGGMSDNGSTQTAPTDGRIVELWDEKQGGGSWTAADYDATDFGFITRT